MGRGQNRVENRVGVVRTSLIDLASFSPIAVGECSLFFAPPPPPVGEMVLATSGKTQDKELPLGAPLFLVLPGNHPCIDLRLANCIHFIAKCTLYTYLTPVYVQKHVPGTISAANG